MFLARKEVDGSKGYKSLLIELCVVQLKLSDTVGDICTCNTLE